MQHQCVLVELLFQEIWCDLSKATWIPRSPQILFWMLRSHIKPHTLTLCLLLVMQMGHLIVAIVILISGQIACMLGL